MCVYLVLVRLLPESRGGVDELGWLRGSGKVGGGGDKSREGGQSQQGGKNEGTLPRSQ